MPPDFLSPQYALLILVAVIGATLLILLVLMRRWRGDTTRQLKKLQLDLKNRQIVIQELTNQISEYKDVDHEPYSSRIEQLQEQIFEIDQLVNQLQENVNIIQEHADRVTKDPFRSILGAPVFWLTVKRDIDSQRKMLVELDQRYQNAQQTYNAIQKLGWEVAKQVREARGLDQQLHLMLEQLQSKNVHGENFVQAIERETRAQEALNRIPAYFEGADQETVLGSASQESIAHAHRILADIRPELDALHDEVKSWENQYIEAGKLVTRMRRVLGALESTYYSSPEALDLDEHSKRLEGLNIISQNLQATLSRLEVDSIPAVITEASRVLETAQSMDIELRNARRQLSELEVLYKELNNGMNQLSTQFGALATSQNYPVDWTQSRIQLTDLSRLFSEIGPAHQTRSIQRLKQDYTKAGLIDKGIEELANHLRTVADQHRELLNMVKLPEIEQGEAWFQENRILAQKTTEYAPENWAKADAVSTFGDDLTSVHQAMSQWIYEKSQEPIPENRVAERLETTRQLLQYYNDLRNRSQRIQNRLDELESIENRARERLKISEAKITQASYLIASNGFLEQEAINQLKQLKLATHNLEDMLDQHQLGILEKKVKQVTVLEEKIESDVRGWIKKLNNENDNQSKALSSSVRKLDEIAPLTDRSINDARELLAKGSIRPTSSSVSGSKQMDSIQELKLASDYWQECLAIRKSIEEIEAPVVDAYSAAVQNREKAREQIDHLSKWLGKRRDWPPTSVSIDAETKEYAQLEQQWKSIQTTTSNPIGIVHQLSELAGKYQTLAEKVYRSGEQVAREHQDIGELESELEEYARNWQALWHAHRYSEQADQEIRQLIDKINADFEQIKSDYKTNRKSFTDVMQTLKLLNRRVRLAQVSIDESHVLNVDGQVIAFRGQ